MASARSRGARVRSNVFSSAVQRERLTFPLAQVDDDAHDDDRVVEAEVAPHAAVDADREERDHLRAQIIRERLKVFPKPDISKLVRESGNGATASPSDNE